MPPQKKTLRARTPIADFMASQRTAGTAGAYRAGVILFLDSVYGKVRKGKYSSPEEFSQYEKLAATYLQDTTRDHKQDLIAFVRYMQKEETPNTTLKLKVAAVREFYTKYGIELTTTETKEIVKILPRRAYRETDFEYMNVEKLQSLLPFLDIRLKALVLCLCSSGARINELLTLTIGDLHIDDVPAYAYIRNTKTGANRKVYFTHEAVAALKQWFSVRDQYMKETNENIIPQFRRNPAKEKRVFPFVASSLYRQYDKALLKAGLFRKDDKTKRNVLNIHRLRAFFRETVAGVVGSDTAELLLGHVDQYGDAYRNMPEQQLAEKYLKCEEALTISKNTRIERDIRVQADIIGQLEKEKEELKARLTTLEQAQASQAQAVSIADTAMIKNASDPAFVDAVARRLLELQKQRKGE
jgi:integrase